MARVRFCGNCNPDVHPREVRKRLDMVVSWVGPDTEVLINGCDRVCLVKSPALSGSSKRIAVHAREVAAGTMVPLPLPDAEK